MPYPRKGESEKHYVGRAIPIISKEHPELPRKAIIGRAFGMYDTYKGGRKPRRRRRALTQ